MGYWVFGWLPILMFLGGNALAEGDAASLNLRIEVHQFGQAVPLIIERADNGQHIHRATLLSEPFVIRTPERNWSSDPQDDLALQITTLEFRALVMTPWDVESAKANYYFPGTGMAQETDSTRELMLASPECDGESGGKPMLSHQYITRSRFDHEQDGFRDIDVTAIRDFCQDEDLLRRGETLYLVFLLNRAKTDTMADGFDENDADILKIVFSADTS